MSDTTIEELREIADWFASCGRHANAEFLIAFANRYEVLSGAYATKQRVIDEYLSAIIAYQDASDPAVLVPLTEEICNLADEKFEQLRSHRSKA